MTSISATLVDVDVHRLPRNHNRSRSSDGIRVASVSTTMRRKNLTFTPAAPLHDSNRSTPTESPALYPPPRPVVAKVTPSLPERSIPLVPIPFRPGHLKSSSDHVTSPTGDQLRAAFPGRRGTPMVRKKSGELVRSSLKFGEMSKIETPPAPKSEPATPTFVKVVHFDTQLEHVKLFLTQQKPAAVSRSGSPTLETETEDEPESFPFPAMSTTSPGLLSLRLPNFPPRLDVTQDAFLESLEIAADGKSLRGIVRVKNLSFAKWVAVRFTLDHWQTVSEVSAEHLQSFSATSDRFVFAIKLQDVLARIEERSMLIAIRYTVDGREIWDNNGGENYKVEFAKQKPIAPPAPRVVKPPGDSQQKMAELTRELDRLVMEESKPSRRGDPGSFTEAAAFSRYDFGSSFKQSSYRSTSSSGTNRTSPSNRPAPLPFPIPSSQPHSSPRSTTHSIPSYSPYPYDATTPSARDQLPPDFGDYSSMRSPLPRQSYDDSTHVTANFYQSYSNMPDSSLHQNGSPLLPPSFRENHSIRLRSSPLSSPSGTPTDSPFQSQSNSPLSNSPPRSAAFPRARFGSIEEDSVSASPSSLDTTPIPGSPVKTADDLSTFLNQVSPLIFALTFGATY